MTSSRAIFLITIAAAIFLANATDPLEEVRKAVDDISTKLVKAYGQEKVDKVKEILSGTGETISNMLSEKLKKIQEILGFPGGSEAGNPVVQAVDSELVTAINDLKERVRVVFKAARKGAMKGVKKLGKKMDKQ